jgi:hypothetical protein
MTSVGAIQRYVLHLFFFLQMLKAAYTHAYNRLQPFVIVRKREILEQVRAHACDLVTQLQVCVYTYIHIYIYNYLK